MQFTANPLISPPKRDKRITCQSFRGKGNLPSFFISQVVQMLHIHKEILSFSDMPGIAEQAKRTVMLVRHSIRESLQNGSHDPGLTVEGREYARQCGTFLRGMKDVCFGSSFRKRTVETVQALIEGAGFIYSEIKLYPDICDTAQFLKPEDLDITIDNGNIPLLLNQYFSTGFAERMRPLAEYHKQLLEFLTTTEFEKKNTILASHDIVVAALLLPLNVYPFHQNDWCGYVQGAALFQSVNGDWNIGYIVPDRNSREKFTLFV